MKLLIAIAIMAVVSVAGSKITFLDRRLPLGFRNILFTGAEYIFIGILLGGMGLNILDIETRTMLEPFLIFSLSWIGFLFGVQFEIRYMKRLPRNYFSITAIQSAVTFLFISFLVYLLIPMIPGSTGIPRLVVATVLGATGACTAQSAIAIVNRNYRVKNRDLLDLLRYISSVDGLFAIIFFIIALGMAAGLRNGVFSFQAASVWFITAILAGVLPAIILILLSRVRFTQQEYLVFLVGTIMFTGGMACHLHQSPLISGLVCGVLVANFCRHRLRAMEIVVHAEKSIYIILLLFLGAGWQITINTGLILVAIYLLARLSGKLFGVWLATRWFKTRFQIPFGLGLGLISEGGLAVAMILDCCILIPQLSIPLISIIIVSIIINELLSPSLILAQFREVENA